MQNRVKDISTDNTKWNGENDWTEWNVLGFEFSSSDIVSLADPDHSYKNVLIQKVKYI